MTAPMDLTIADLSELIRSRAVSPVEVTRACLERIGALNGAVNAFVTIDEEGALTAAREAEGEITAGGWRGPLHGVPVAHKDLYWTKGLRSTAGSRLRADFVPEEDATAVARWRAAGGVLLGKLNTEEFAYGPTSENSMFGPSRNPWDTGRITGGSSGGSGAAVALGLCFGATGSDTGGSIRIPSACCGVTGIKPTYGRASRHGIFPLAWSLDHPGPLARSVEDAAILLQPMVGRDGKDAAVRDRPVPDYRAALQAPVKGLRIGVPSAYFFDRADAEVEAAVRAAIGVLEGLGVAAEEVEIADIEHVVAAISVICYAEATAYHDDDLVARGHLLGGRVRHFVEFGNLVLAKDYLHAQRYRTHLGRIVAAILGRVDLLVMPTLPMTATPVGAGMIEVRGVRQHASMALLRNTEPFNLTGLPALSVPCGFSAEGLPIGMQIVGRPFDEAAVLRLGHAYQRATDWHTRRPEMA